MLDRSRLQKVKTRKLQLAGTGERLMISNSYNRHNARYRCSPVPARKNLLFAGDSDLQVSKRGDFIIKDKERGGNIKYIVEVGGKNKDFKQIQDIENSYLVLDVICSDHPRKVPLWLFGFLY
jgi:hypothetical protein